VAGTISKIVNSAEAYVIGIAVIIVTLTIMLTLIIIRRSINLPLLKIISEIDSIKLGSLIPDETVFRNDEWGTIERALRDMQTELNRSSVALRESEFRFRSIFNNSPIAIGIGLKGDGRLIDVNDAWLQIFGFKREEVIGRTTADLNLYRNDEDRNSLIMDIDELGHIVNHEVQMRRKSGDIIVTQYSAQIVKLGTESVLQVMMTDITEHKQTEEKLHKKNADMEQFIYTVSHDLRSPLVTVKAFLGFLENDMSVNNQERISQDLQFIHGAADKMKLLLDELLELSRIDRVEAPPVRVSLRDVLDEVMGTLAGEIYERKAEITRPESDLILLADRLRLCQIWQNLIENALKYRHDDRILRIELGVQQMSGETTFFVRDNGIGINPQYQTKIFGIFEKLDQNSPGAGLGLSMIQRIIEKCGGRVWVESEGVGKGSCFFFTLPQAIV